MKQIIIITIFLAFATLLRFAQNKTGLEVKNYKSHKTIFIKDGAKVKIKEAGKKNERQIKSYLRSGNPR